MIPVFENANEYLIYAHICLQVFQEDNSVTIS